jgi:hypothetical protein
MSDTLTEKIIGAAIECGKLSRPLSLAMQSAITQSPSPARPARG